MMGGAERILLVASAALILAGHCGASAAVPRASAAHAAAPRAAADRLDPAAPIFGVNVDLLALPPGELDAALDRMAGAGVRWVRAPLGWANLEPARGQRRFDELDRVVAALGARQMRLDGVLGTSPAWARPPARPTPPPGFLVCDDPALAGPRLDDRGPPSDAAPLADFAAEIAARYPGTLAALEVWDEPNLMPNWRALGPDPEDYARLLVAVARAVKRAGPDVLVISAGLAPTVDLGVCSFSDLVFLDRVARTGALGHVDAVGIKPFGLRLPPDDPRADREVLNFRRAELLHATLQRLGVAKPLWSVAWGWHVPVGPTGAPESAWGDIPPQTAAAWTIAAWELARRDWPWLGAMFLWRWQPPLPAGDPAWGYALIGSDGQPTPLWSAAQTIASGRIPAPSAGGANAAGASSSLPSAAPMAASTALTAALRSGQVAAPAAAATDGGATAPAAEASRVSRAALTLLFVLVAAITWLPIVRARVAPMLRRALVQMSGWPPVWAALAYAAGIAVGLVLPGWLGLAGALACILVAAAQRDVAFAAVGVGLPLYYALNLRLGPVPMDVAEYLMWLAVGGAFVRRYAHSRDDAMNVAAARSWLGRLHPLDWAVVVLVVYAGLSPWWAEWFWSAAREWRTVILEPALVYGLLRLSPRPVISARSALDGLVAGAFIAAAWALGELGAALVGWGGASVVQAEGVWRVNGPYASPNNLALVLGRVFPYVVAGVLFGGHGRRWVMRLVGVSILAALFATFSRGALFLGLPAAAACLAGVWLARRGVAWGSGRARRLVLVAIAVTVGAGVLLAPFAGTDRLRRAVSLRPGSTAYVRLHVWSSTVDMIRDHPLLGVGLDNFLPLYRDRYVHREVVQERSLNHPHNAVLDWTVRLGLPGLALFAAFVAGNLAAGRQALRGASGTRSLAAGALGMQVYALAHGLIDNSFFLVDLAAMWFMAQAALLAAGGRRIVGGTDEDGVAAGGAEGHGEDLVEIVEVADGKVR